MCWDHPRHVVPPPWSASPKDVGVHALTVAKRLEELGGGRVIAVEPAADCFATERSSRRCP
ncbi:hypothetical protein OG558_13040 [Kribbella sp. NBC_01510]|uniref:hypothetical protein n=1 Tax=Kribbella sp. NBC_01510 TaxID=2903581 RepID=UPI00387088F3